MSVAAQETPAAMQPGPAPGRLDRLLAWCGDRLNPILVKETRQALKSRQFVVTFMLMLLAAWAWSLAGPALIGIDLSYAFGGREMFQGYAVILSFPLVVMVPFGAFRSLAVEQEDRTGELIAVTTLAPRQIVSGKLGSAVLQMIVYLSAIVPCLAFTYLLRGIDLGTILFQVHLLVLASLGLSMLAMLLATAGSQRHTQVTLMVLVVAGLMLAWYGMVMNTVEIISSPPRLSSGEFLIGWLLFLCNAAGLFALAFLAAAARLSFASDNRATRLRVAMLVEFALLLGTAGWVYWERDSARDACYVFSTLSLLYWTLLGALMAGESPTLSRRVQRGLPQSLLGRIVCTWFRPGPAAGYGFVLCNLLCLLLLTWLGTIEWFRASRIIWVPGGQVERLQMYVFLGACYVTLYLGLGQWIVRQLRRWHRGGLGIAFLVHLLLVAAGCAVPGVIHALRDQAPLPWYGILDLPNAFWTLAEQGTSSRTLPDYVFVVIPCAAAIAVGMNLPALLRVVHEQRIAAPPRVVEEDRQQELQRNPPGRKNPWE